MVSQCIYDLVEPRSNARASLKALPLRQLHRRVRREPSLAQERVTARCPSPRAVNAREDSEMAGVGCRGTVIV